MVVVPGLAGTGGGWSQATIAEPFVFVSGQVAWDAAAEVVGTTIAEQAEVVFDNLELALAAAGSGLDRLVKVGVHLVSRDDLGGFREVRDRRLAGIAPASTLTLVGSLVDPRLLVEVDAVATLDRA